MAKVTLELDPFGPPLLEGTIAALGMDGSAAPTELALASLVRLGLPTGTVDALLQHGIPESDVFPFVTSHRTFHRRRAAAEPLTAGESDRAERLARLLALATAVLGDTKRAVHWMSSPKKHLNEQRPLDFVGSSAGTKLVEEMLLRAYYGNVA
jgi:putative toxin-antitoxin system antitoxin component (TIGR02293 family)